MKKYIITDPCYIIDSRQYDAIGEVLGWGEFETMKTPCKLSLRNDKEPLREGVEIVIHKIDGTPNGDGSMEYHGQQIGVDAGMLCIAECQDGWRSQSFGAKFETLAEAEAAWPRIIKHF